jgi:hypothetical protein
LRRAAQQQRAANQTKRYPKPPHVTFTSLTQEHPQGAITTCVCKKGRDASEIILTKCNVRQSLQPAAN